MEAHTKNKFLKIPTRKGWKGVQRIFLLIRYIEESLTDGHSGPTPLQSHPDLEVWNSGSTFLSWWKPHQEPISHGGMMCIILDAHHHPMCIILNALHPPCISPCHMHHPPPHNIPQCTTSSHYHEHPYWAGAGFGAGRWSVDAHRGWCAWRGDVHLGCCAWGFMRMGGSCAMNGCVAQWGDGVRGVFYSHNVGTFR